MQCLWPSTRARETSGFGLSNAPASPFLIARALFRLLVVASASVALASSLLVVPQRISSGRDGLAEGERRLRRVPAHISEFSPVSEPLALSKCGDTRPPEALLTPDPLMPAQAKDLPVRVSFIVGADGHVHSAFVLNSGGPDEDDLVVRTVLRWRYRPALCNGVPTDSEARVRFSIQ